MHINYLIELSIILIGAIGGCNFRFFVIRISRNLKKCQVFSVLSINLMACFFLGLSLTFLIDNQLNNYQDLFKSFLIGFIGSFSTFSTFMYDLFKLAAIKNYKGFILYTLSSILLGLVFIFVLYFMSQI